MTEELIWQFHSNMVQGEVPAGDSLHITCNGQPLLTPLTPIPQEVHMVEVAMQVTSPQLQLPFHD